MEAFNTLLDLGVTPMQLPELISSSTGTPKEMPTRALCPAIQQYYLIHPNNTNKAHQQKPG